MPVPVMSMAILPSRALETRTCDLQHSDVCPLPWENVQKLALCLYPALPPRRGAFSFLLFPFLLSARDLLTHLLLPLPPHPGAGYTKDRPELALNAKLAFSILHKVHGTMATCLGRNHSSLQAASGFSGP